MNANEFSRQFLNGIRKVTVTARRRRALPRSKGRFDCRANSMVHPVRGRNHRVACALNRRRGHAVDDDMLVGFEREQVVRCERCHGARNSGCFGERLAGVLEAELFRRRQRKPARQSRSHRKTEAPACRMHAMTAGAGKNFRTGNVGTAMVVLHIVFRSGYTRKHYPEPFRTC